MADLATHEGCGSKEARADHEPYQDGAREDDAQRLSLSTSPQGDHRPCAGDEDGYQPALSTFLVRLGQRLGEPGLLFDLLLCRLPGQVDRDSAERKDDRQQESRLGDVAGTPQETP